jgi:class 3 adenylate cyclase
MGLFGALHRRLGRRYPRMILAAELAVAHLVVAVGVSTLLLYEPMSTGEFFLILAAEEVLISLETLFAYRLVSRLIRPADPWLRGDRSPEAAHAAWCALAGLPSEWIRRWKVYPILFNGLPFAVLVTWILDLPWYSATFVLAGGVVILVYGLFLRFFAAELALRPVLVQASGDLDHRTPIPPVGITLRARLLVGLPVLTMLTGSLVAGLSNEGDREIADLGLDVLVAVAVAGTVAFELTLLLAKSILRPIDDLRRATQRVAEGDLAARVALTSTDEVGQLAESFNRMVDGLEEREALREAFGAYVDPGIAERVLAEGPSLEGDEVEVSLLFLDIRDFTAFAERSAAREVVTELNDFYNLVVPILAAHGGHANKFVGDGLLGVFGAPTPLADHADRAVGAALEICSRVEETYGERLRIGIGVNSGPVVAGSIGGGGRMEFTVIGDPVNTACRVEELTRETGETILITDATRCLLARGQDTWIAREPVRLKGKRDPVALYGRGTPSESAAPAPVERPVSARP